MNKSREEVGQQRRQRQRRGVKNPRARRKTSTALRKLPRSKKLKRVQYRVLRVNKEIRRERQLIP